MSALHGRDWKDTARKITVENESGIKRNAKSSDEL